MCLLAQFPCSLRCPGIFRLPGNISTQTARGTPDLQLTAWSAMHTCLAPLNSIAVCHGTGACPWAGSALLSALQRMPAQQLWHHWLVLLPLEPRPDLWSAHKHLAQAASPGEKSPCSPSHHNARSQGQGPQHWAGREQQRGNYQSVIKVETQWWSWQTRLKIICFDPIYFYSKSNMVQLISHLKTLDVQKAFK